MARKGKSTEEIIAALRDAEARTEERSQAGKQCGRTALRLTFGSAKSSGVEFFGRYERSEGAEPYVVNANLHLTTQQNLPKDQLTLSIRGNTGGTFEAFRRIFPLHMVLMREGEVSWVAVRPRSTTPLDRTLAALDCYCSDLLRASARSSRHSNRSMSSGRSSRTMSLVAQRNDSPMRERKYTFSI